MALYIVCRLPVCHGHKFSLGQILKIKQTTPKDVYIWFGSWKATKAATGTQVFSFKFLTTAHLMSLLNTLLVPFKWLWSTPFVLVSHVQESQAAPSVLHFQGLPEQMVSYMYRKVYKNNKMKSKDFISAAPNCISFPTLYLFNYHNYLFVQILQVIREAQHTLQCVTPNRRTVNSTTQSNKTH